MATDFVLDADTGYDREELPSIRVRMDGVEYTAHCPKDSLPVLMARLQDAEAIKDDPALPERLVHQILLSIFDRDDAAEVLDRLLDMGERKITLAYVIHVVRMVADHYQTDLEAQYAEMGMDNPLRAPEPEPANREQRRALAKAPAKKTTAKKTAAKKTTARKA